MENKNLEDLSKNDNEISSQTQFAQMHNGDACIVKNENGEDVSYFDYIYPDADKDACQGTD